ncbi:hypothetical protein [Isoptericola chiayiensis]|uniref:hypothetical protein n=1 Tax=Isoptericola chiayiensis TaxID=579446 RepID=UPI001555FEFA|nr:hypothetical protein [Isoptericola chiayiensis]NOW00253.1 hypothetical protein [Isoptericola chiayiensis]
MQTDTVLAVPTDPAARDALLERVRAVTDVDHPALEPVGAAVARPDGGLVVPRGDSTTTELATVLAVRGRCSAPEAAGLAVALGQALAALHSSEIVHGGLDVADVVLDLEGHGRLRPRLDVPPARAGEADDVHDVAALVDRLLGDTDDDSATALRAALAPALAADPRIRPAAGTLAADVHDAVAPQPVRLPEPAVLAAAALAGGRRQTDAARGPGHVRARRVPKPSRGTVAAEQHGRRTRRQDRRRQDRRRRSGEARRGPVPRGTLVAGAGVLAVVAVAFLVLDGPLGPSAGAEPAVPAPAAPASAAPAGPGPLTDVDDPAGAAAALTRLRPAVLAGERDVDELAVPGSPAHEDDLALVARASDVRLTVPDVDVLATEPVATPGDGTATVLVRYTVGAHEQSVDGTVTAVPAGEPRTDRLHLAWTDDGWRVRSVG